MLWHKLLTIMTMVLFFTGQIHGMVIDENTGENVAKAVSRRGLQIGNKYIVTVRDSDGTGSACDHVKSRIRAYRNDRVSTNSDDEDSYVSDDDDDIEVVTIRTTCNVFFETTDTGLLKYVNESVTNVIDVEPDTVVVLEAAPASWGLDRIDQPSLPLSETPFAYLYTGAGVNIYVFDTGILTTHTDFGGRASIIKDYTNELDEDIEDGNGHGTHCAGTAGGTVYGVAKGSNLLGIKVLDSSGDGSISNVVKAISFAVDYQQNNYGTDPAVFSISLGGKNSEAMKNVASEAAESGMIVVVAAGNNATNACTYSPAGAGGNGTNYGVISVGATSKTDTFPDYSNFGSCVDILAPGSSITSDWIGSNTATNTISGTSMSTPHVAGTAAMLLEKNNMDRDAAVDDLFSLAVTGQISGVNSTGTVNLLVQIPTYTGPPTAPTAFGGTAAPSASPAEVWVEVDGETHSVEFEKSEFGESFPSSSVIAGPLVVAEDLMCNSTTEDFSDSVVLIARGNCTFYEKVVNAQNQGAIAVIFHMDTNASIFSPTYYSTDIESTVVSVMISLEDGLAFAEYASEGATAKLGSPTYDSALPESSTDSPTPAPTAAPTVACSTYDGHQKKCKRRNYCTYDASDETCYETSGSDIPCTIIKSKRKCGQNDRCLWAVLPTIKKSAACYEADDVPTDTDIYTPESCSKGKFSYAQSTCGAAIKGLCSAAELLANPDDEATCRIDSKWVWSNTSCGKNKYYLVKYNKQKVRCRKRNVRAAIRCCDSTSI